MSSPLNANDLPAGWERAPMRGDEVAIRHEEGHLVVKAVRLPGDEEWRLELEDSVHNRFTTVRPMGSVSGEERAAEQLLALAKLVNEMRRKHDEVRPNDIVQEATDDDSEPVVPPS